MELNMRYAVADGVRIVSSTTPTERMGDTRFRDASRALDAGLRAAIRDAGGAAIDGKLRGDGVTGIGKHVRVYAVRGQP